MGSGTLAGVSHRRARLAQPYVAWVGLKPIQATAAVLVLSDQPPLGVAVGRRHFALATALLTVSLTSTGCSATQQMREVLQPWPRAEACSYSLDAVRPLGKDISAFQEPLNAFVDWQGLEPLRKSGAALRDSIMSSIGRFREPPHPFPKEMQPAVDRFVEALLQLSAVTRLATPSQNSNTDLVIEERTVWSNYVKSVPYFTAIEGMDSYCPAF